MTLSTATPKILQDPGYLFLAPLGSAVPTHTVVGGVFTDDWPVAWISAGATKEGSELSYQLKLEAIKVAEFFDPVRWAATERTASLAFAMTDWSLSRLATAWNTSAPAVVSGTGDTTLSKLSPPDPDDIIHVMVGWESLDNTLRAVAYSAVNGGEVQTSFKKAPDISTIPVEFQFEKTSSGLIDLWAAGTTRG